MDHTPNPNPVTKPKLSILLIEDNEADSQLIAQFLLPCAVPAQLSILTDGEKAMEYLRSNEKTPNLVILDLNIPRKDGRTVLKEMKNQPKLAAVPIIILSTSSYEQDINECYENHANAYIVKPAQLEEFESAIHHIRDFWLNTSVLPKPRGRSTRV